MKTLLEFVVKTKLHKTEEITDTQISKLMTDDIEYKSNIITSVINNLTDASKKQNHINNYKDIQQDLKRKIFDDLQQLIDDNNIKNIKFEFYCPRLDTLYFITYKLHDKPMNVLGYIIWDKYKKCFAFEDDSTGESCAITDIT